MSYDRRASFKSYADRLTDLQEPFVVEIAQDVAQTLERFPERGQEPESWNYGLVGSKGKGHYHLVAYMQSKVEAINIEVQFDDRIEVQARSDRKPFLRRKFEFRWAARDIGTEIAEAWKKRSR